MPVKFALIMLPFTLLASPVAGHGAGKEAEPLAEPAVQAEWLNNTAVQRVFVKETKGFSRFEARPALKIGLMVEADGTVSECLPLALEKGGPAYGKELCPIISEYAKFKTARDADGNAIRSVFIVLFDEYRPGSVAENRTFG